MKNKEFLLAEQIGASDNPLGEIVDLKILLDRLEKMYCRRKQIYDETRPAKKAWWKKRLVIRWRSP